jgi:hypothetical protein
MEISQGIYYVHRTILSEYLYQTYTTYLPQPIYIPGLDQTYSEWSKVRLQPQKVAGLWGDYSRWRFQVAASPRTASLDSAFIIGKTVTGRAFPSNVATWRESRNDAACRKYRGNYSFFACSARCSSGRGRILIYFEHSIIL